MITAFLSILGILVACGLAALLTSGRPRLAGYIGTAGPIAGFFLIPGVSLWTIFSGTNECFTCPWELPFGAFTLSIDPLAAWFMLPVGILCGCGAVYGSGYLGPEPCSRRTGAHWWWYNLLEAGMLLVLVAADAVVFLYAWEIMSVAAFFLVTYEHGREAVRKAGWIYLVATHFGTFCILLAFILLGIATGSFGFAGFAQAAKSPVLASAVFMLALAGFGSKAGFVIFHVWLPEAHPAAPSHVSAVMSGVMIKMGIYGLVRVLILLGGWPEWWAWTLIATGIGSGLFGVLFALAQHDLKRLLAYHSVENIGIITMGLGLGLLGVSRHCPVAAVLGFGGGLLHVFNHGLFKGLLFLGAGALLHETGTAEIDRLGGLAKRMPWTAAGFGIGSASISGLPPFNGFISEFLIYMAALSLLLPFHASSMVVALITVIALALIGGLALACFTKAVGVVFLGEPRSRQAAAAHEVSWLLRGPMLLLTCGCVAAGLAAPAICFGMTKVIACCPGMTATDIWKMLAPGAKLLGYVALGGGGLIILTGILWLIRRLLPEAKTVDATSTWDCGYLRPSSRMQYTGSSFAQPLTRFFYIILYTVRHGRLPDKSLFPDRAEFESHTPDLFVRFLFGPLFAVVRNLCLRCRWIQDGRLQWYILYIAAALVIVLVWKLF